MFLGLLMGCDELPDGSTVLRAFPALTCEEIENRMLIGCAGTLALCAGLPLVCAVLAALYLKRKFKSALSYFLVRSVFSGFKDSAAGLGFKIFCLGRIFCLVLVVTSAEWAGETSQLIGLQGVLTTTLFIDGLTQPRTTTSMNILGSVQEMVVFIVLEIGFAATGLKLASQVHYEFWTSLPVYKSCGACSRHLRRSGSSPPRSWHLHRPRSIHGPHAVLLC